MWKNRNHKGKVQHQFCYNKWERQFKKLKRGYMIDNYNNKEN